MLPDQIAGTARPPLSGTRPARHRRGVMATTVAALVLVTGLTACSGKSPGEGDAPASPTVVATPGVTGTASPDSTDGPAPLKEPTWLQAATALTAAIDPFISTVLAVDGETWLVQLIAGPEGKAFTQLVPIAPETGQPKAVAGEASAMPDGVFCAQHTWQGQVLCAWQDGVYQIDPQTGQPAAAPLLRVAGQELYGVEVVGEVIVAVGLAETAPVATAFDAAGAQLWQSPFETAGCALEDPAYQVSVTPVQDTIRVALASRQAVMTMADGQVLTTACGLVAYLADGRMAVAQQYGTEPAPPKSYTTPDGATKAVINAGPAQQLTAISAGGKEYLVTVQINDQRLRLLDGATGELVWDVEWQYGRLQTWDDQYLFMSGRRGLSGVDLATGEAAWTWQQDLGMSVRSAVLTRDAGLVVSNSMGVSGVSPQSGQTLWSIEDADLAAYYWTPDGLDPEAARQSNMVVFLGPNRDRMARFDAPVL